MSILSCYRFSVTKLNLTKNLYFLLGFQSLAEESRIISVRTNVYRWYYQDKYLLLVLISKTTPHNGNRSSGENIMIATILVNLSLNIYSLFRTLPLFRITIPNHFFFIFSHWSCFPFFSYDGWNWCRFFAHFPYKFNFIVNINWDFMEGIKDSKKKDYNILICLNLLNENIW